MPTKTVPDTTRSKEPLQAAEGPACRHFSRTAQTFSLGLDSCVQPFTRRSRGTRHSTGCVADDAVRDADGDDDVSMAHALDTGTVSEDSSDVSIRVCPLAALLPAPLLYRILTLCNLVHNSCLTSLQEDMSEATCLRRHEAAIASWRETVERLRQEREESRQQHRES